MNDEHGIDNRPEALGESSRTFHRFDSLRELIEFCRNTYGTDDVVATREGRSLVVRITPPDGEPFTRMVVHFEGERTYMVGLPEGAAEEKR